VKNTGPAAQIPRIATALGLRRANQNVTDGENYRWLYPIINPSFKLL
jgi:hypothetical protein